MWVALKRDGNSVVAFGGSDKIRLVTASARSDVPLLCVVVAPLVNDFVDDSLWNVLPSLNDELLEVSCVTHCSLVNSFLHETRDMVVWAVWRPQIGCNELWSLLLQ